MELTQRLGCTQTINEASAESILPEQVAFLGICGQKYPVMRGPNKIGRDPDTCNIVLRLNSISRHHAVINALNSSEYMLMDLNSANKTKLENKILDPYIPYPLRNGNMVQLGDVFGIFTLLHDDSDLPMTQAMEIPDTPLTTRHISKFNNVHHHTTVPESPDVSDKDDSFIMPTQPKMKEFMGPHNNPSKLSGKPLFIPKVVTKKIDNAYWNSSRKSDSFNLQSNTSNTSLNSSQTSLKSLDTKGPTNDIHELNTQIPNDLGKDESRDSLFTADTQAPESRRSINIYNMATQVPHNENLPAVCKIQDQHNVAFDFFTDNKENNSIFEAKTQTYNVHKPETAIVKDNVKMKLQKNCSNTSQDTSNDVIIFEEMASPPVVEIFESQALLPTKDDIVGNDLVLYKNEVKTERDSIRNVRVKSNSSTDCEDGDDDIISLSQNVFQKLTDDDDLTDCEDVPECQVKIRKLDVDDDMTDCEEDLFEKGDKICDKSNSDKFKSIELEDLPTQIVAEDLPSGKSKNDIQFEDMLTQVIDVVPQSKMECGSNIEDMLTQVIIENENKQTIKPLQFQTNISMSPFKVPQSPFKSKRDSKNTTKQQISVVSKSTVDDDFYASTQEVFDDLCSQVDSVDAASHEPVSVEILTSEKIEVPKSTKTSSDSSSDVEKTPKKLRPLTFMETDLPDSQEIRSSVTLNNRHNTIDVSSESETENDSQKCTPILFRNKKKKSNDAKLNLNKKFQIDALPTRIITRVRKPTSKASSNADISKKTTTNILKPTFLTEQEDNIDKEIITENISRLKSKAAKPLTKEKSAKKDKTNSDKRSRNKKDREEKSDKKSEGKNTEKNSNRNKEVLNITEEHSSKSDNKSELLSRSTRSGTRKKVDNDKKSTSPEMVKAKSNKSDQNNKSENSTHSRLRRSTRQKNRDDVGHRNSKHNEKSTVYNVSSETSLDSSNAAKRSADFLFPSAKKAKTSSGGHASSSKYTIDTQYVLFTAFPNEEVKHKLESLGAVVVSDVASCTVVLTLQIKRTFKLLCAVGLGRPIVGPEWVQACADADCIVEPNQYILKDEAAEKRFQFELQRTVRGRRNFLKGYKVSCTPRVTPNAQELKAMVECSGGTWKEGGRNWLCMSCTADRPLWPQYRRRGAVVVSTELVLAGVLRQQLDVEANRLL